MERTPVAAGTFYPANHVHLETLLAGLFQEATTILSKYPVVAVIVPHAGYVYSGKVAAAGIAQIDRNKSYQHIFLIGSSHTHIFRGASVYTEGNYVTPLGSIPIDPLASKLIEAHTLFNNRPEIQAHEHALEVILPFLQFWLKNPFTIVPIIIGGESEDTPRQLAQILKPYLNDNNLFIVSSDFSHYPSYSNAVLSDNFLADAIVSGNPECFLQTKKEIESRNIPNLVTAACGWTAILTLLYMINGSREYNISKICYQNSGDCTYGQKNKVVGYYAIGIHSIGKTELNTIDGKTGEIVLDKEDKQKLLAIARNTLDDFVRERIKYQIPSSLITENLRQRAGAFVTLKKDGELRGCIGTFHPRYPLYQTIRDLTISSAAYDHRFEPVNPDELENIKIEISVLTPLRKIHDIEEIEMGKDGILLKHGIHSGTFLPQVALQTNWTKEEFLGHCARDKAGIGWYGWKNAEIYAFRAIIIEEESFQ